jgi:plastocyanin
MAIRSLTLAALAALVLGLATVALARPAATKKLQGTVGPGYTISLKQNGKRVKSLKPGTYSFSIRDKASIHNFVIEKESGKKFEKQLTGVSFQGSKTVTVKLAKGEWKYYCKPHESQMHGSFRVK